MIRDPLLTPKDTTVRQMLECRTLPDRSRVYLVVTTLTRNTTFVIGKGLKKVGTKIPEGTEYYKTLDEAYAEFMKIRDHYHDKKNKDGIWLSQNGGRHEV